MYNIEILKSIPPLLTGEKLKTALTAMPQYDEKIVLENEAVRLMELSNLYKIYLPSEMSVEIYSKLNLALIHSLNKKIGKNAVRQQNENYKIICGRENSAGVISVVISLIHDAQEISILNGREVLDIASLNEAYNKRLTMLHEYIEPSIKKRSQTAKTKKTLHFATEQNNEERTGCTVSYIVNIAKESEKDVLKVLKKYITVEEIKV